MNLPLRLGALAVLGALTACTGGEAGTADKSQDVGLNKTGLPVVDEKITLTFSGEKAPLAPEYDSMSLVRDWEKDTNIDIRWDNLPTTVYQEKKNLLLAGGDLPDAFYNTGFTDEEIVRYGANGTLLPLEDLISAHAPNLSALLEERPDIRAALTAPDGHIYSLPKVEELGIGAVPFFWSINTAWLDELGLEMPSSVEEYEAVLRAFKTEDPNGNGQADEIPLSFMNDWWCADVGDLFAAISGMPDNPDHRIVRDDTVIYTAAQEEYREAIATLHRWYADGLIDAEAFTQTDAQYLAKGQGRTPVLGSFVWWETEEVVGAEHADDYRLMAPLSGPAGQLVGRSNGSDIGRNGFAITRANEYPAATMRWVDRLYDPTMSAQVSWGPIGEGLRKNEDGVLVSMLDQGSESASEVRQKIAPDGPRAILADQFGTLVEPEPRAAQRMKDLEEIYLPHIEPQSMPPVLLTVEEVQRLSALDTEITALVEKKKAEWIVRGGIEEEWDEYVAQLEDIGLEEYVGIYQAAYDRYLEAQRRAG